MAQDPLDEFDLTPLLARRVRRKAAEGPRATEPVGVAAVAEALTTPDVELDRYTASAPNETACSASSKTVSDESSDNLIATGLVWALGALCALAVLAVAGVGYLVADTIWPAAMQTPTAVVAAAPARALPFARVKPRPAAQRVRPVSERPRSAMTPGVRAPRPAQVDADGNCLLQGDNPAAHLHACLTWFNNQTG